MLRVKKLCLNVIKTELVIFNPSRLKIEVSFRFKLIGKRLMPTKFAKCSEP